MELQNLTKEEAFIVKWQYRILGGFETALIECIKLADRENLIRLATGFPDEVRGYLNYTRKEDWWSVVKEKANISEF